MKKLLPIADKDFVISNIKFALENDGWRNDNVHYPLMTLFDTISEIDGVIILDDDFKMDDGDWYQPLFYKGGKYELRGSLWNGGLHIYEVK